jgi:hypothetical protein
LDGNITNLNVGWLSLIFGVLLNGGALAWWVRSRTDMRLTQRDSADAKKKAEDALTKANVLESRVNQQDTIINEIRTRMAKLDRVDELVAAAKFIEEAVTKNMVPRSEHEKVWKSEEERFSRIEGDIRELKKEKN